MADVAEFRHKIDIKERDISPVQTTVQRVDTFTDLYSSIWANVVQSSDLTVTNHKAVGNSGIFSIDIRYRADITAEMWVFWGDQRMEILGVKFDRKKLYMSLTCEWEDDNYS